MKFIFIFAFLLFSTANAATYYVDFTDGSDSNNGTSSGTAWKNLSKISDATSGDTILLQRGETWVGQQLPIESGITIDDYGSGDLPEISGRIDLSGWTSHGTYGWQVSSSDSTQHIWVNGDLQAWARWPSAGYESSDSGVTCSSITDSALSGKSFSGATIVIKKQNCCIGRTTVTQSGTTLTFNGSIGLPCLLNGGERYYIEGELSELNANGEWYDNGSTIYMEWAQDPDNETSVYAVNFDDATTGGSSSNVTLRDIQFTYWGGIGLDISGDNWTIDRVEFHHLGGAAIDINGQTADNTSITDCVIDDVLEHGIDTSRSQGTAEGLTVDGCTISNIGGSRRWTSSVGTNIRQANGIKTWTGESTITDNNISDVSYGGIWIGNDQTHMTNILVSENRVENYMQTLNDGGCIYFADDMPPSPENPVVSRNMCINGGGPNYDTTTVVGLYPDSGTDNTVFENNVLLNPGEYGHLCNRCDSNIFRYNSCYISNTGTGPSGDRSRCHRQNERDPNEVYDNQIYGNIFMNDDSSGDGKTFEEVRNSGSSDNTGYSYMDYNLHYMPSTNTPICRKNIGQDCLTGGRSYSVNGWCSSFSAECNGIGTDPLYNNTTTDLTLKAASPAIDNGRSAAYPSVDYLGVTRPINNDPDMGAYEYGGTPPVDPDNPDAQDPRGLERGFRRGIRR